MLFDWLVVVRIQKRAFRKEAVERERIGRRNGFATGPSENNKVLNNVAAKGKDWYLMDGPLFGGRESYPREKSQGCCRQGRAKGVGMLSGWAAGTFFYVPRMVDRARNEKRNSPWATEVFFSAGLCTSQKQGIIVEK